MTVSGISLSRFRNFWDINCRFAPGINVLVGENGMGKTNLLEAVYMMTGGKSFRTRLDGELIMFGETESRITGDIGAEGRSQKIEITIRRGQKKLIRKNGAVRKAQELSETLNAVLFSPNDLKLVKDGAEARRRFMDSAISQLRPGYAAALSEYGRIYAHKMRILKDFREKPSLLDMLDGFSESLARTSAVLIRHRAAFTARLSEAAYPIHREFSDAREELEIYYKTVSGVENPLAPVSEVFAAVMEHQREHRKAELDSGLCLIGAHKDDLIISINGSPSRNYASQGQARTAALSMKLAEREIFLRETGEYPVLLLDDVLSELDRGRQEFVLNRIGGGQTLITCCEDEGISKRTGGAIIAIENGQIKRFE